MTPSLAQRHIVAINDDPAVLGLVQDLLEEAGYRVSTQAYVDQDLGAIVDLAPDLLIVGSRWGAADADRGLLQRLRVDPRAAEVPIVLCAETARDVEWLGSHPADMKIQVVLKPFNIDHFTDTIAAMLADNPWA